MVEHICTKSGEIATNAADIKALKKQLDSQEKIDDAIKVELSQLGKVYEVIHALSLNVAVIATETKGTKETVDDIKRDVKCLSQEVDNIKLAPAEDVSYYKRVIVGAVLLAIVGAFMAGKFF